MRYALIDPDGVTRNIITLGDGVEYPLRDGWTLGDPDIHPMPVEPEPIPQVVSPRQMKLAMLGAGLLDSVETFVASQDKTVQISWEYATEYVRSDPLLNQMAAAFNMTSDQVDDLFRSAATL